MVVPFSAEPDPPIFCLLDYLPLNGYEASLLDTEGEWIVFHDGSPPTAKADLHGECPVETANFARKEAESGSGGERH